MFVFMLIEEVTEIMPGRFLTGKACRNEKYKQIRYIISKERVGYIKNEWQVSLGLIVHGSFVEETIKKMENKMKEIKNGQKDKRKNMCVEQI